PACTASRIDGAASVVCNRRPGKAAVHVQNSADCPTANDFFHPSPITSKDRGGPNTEYFECMRGVIVGWPVHRSRILFIFSGSKVVRSNIKTLTPAVLSVKLERPAEAVAKLT